MYLRGVFGLGCVAVVVLSACSDDSNLSGNDGGKDAGKDATSDVVSDASEDAKDGSIDGSSDGGSCSSISVAAGGLGATAAAGAAGSVIGDACYEVWAKTSVATNTPVYFLAGGINSVSQGLQFVVYCYPSLLGVQWNTGQALEAAASCNDGAWHHVAVCRQGTDGGTTHQFTLFFDGVSVGTKSGQVEGGSPQGLTVGGWPGGATTVAPVQVDEVRISSSLRYSGTFTPAKRFATDGTTVALYHFDEGSGTTTADSSGHGYTLPLTSDAGASGVTWQTSCP